MLFMETVVVVFSNLTELINTPWGQNSDIYVKPGGTYSNHLIFKGYAVNPCPV